ncbi:MAG TPA: SDR family NAD(P)-dependent oxidoreductase [Fimbriimonadaceae bacterium]|nr:SDR family NAD(P)-dependent oxidoreductase [Fimbriimonadaceae bacterium]
MLLQGKVSLITGAGSGIGYGAAKRLAKEGSRIGCLGRTAEELSDVCREIKAMGGECMPLVADVSSPEAMQEAVRQLVERWGRIDIVFANAGINGVWAPLEDLTPEEWDQTLSINLKGTFLTVKYTVPYLKKQGGSIIVTSSVNGTRIFSNTGATAYSCSKGGQVIFSRMVALELAPHKVRINTICPGAIKTNIGENTEQRNVEEVKIPVEFPEGEIPLTGDRPGTIEQVAELVLFLASDASSHISGAEIFIDGAQSLLQG